VENAGRCRKDMVCVAISTMGGANGNIEFSEGTIVKLSDFRVQNNMTNFACSKEKK